MKRRFAILLLLLSAPLPAWANAWDAFGVHPPSIALAGAYSALAEDYSAVHYNPAGLAGHETVDLDLGIFYELPRLYIRRPGMETELEKQHPDTKLTYEDIGALQLGITLPLKRLAPRLPLGITPALGLFYPLHTNYNFRVMEHSDYFDPLYNERSARMTIGAGIGFEITDSFSLGVGVIVGQAVKSDLYVNVAIDPETIDVVERTEKVADAGMTADAIVGLLYKPNADLRLAAVWRDDTRLSTRGDVIYQNIMLGDIPLRQPGTPAEHYPDDHDVAQTPQNASLAVAGRPTPGLWLTAEATWYKWSDWILIRFMDQPPVSLRNTVVLRGGVEYECAGYRWRAGVAFEPTPVRTQPANVPLMGNDRLIYGAGFGYALQPSAWAQPMDVDLALGYHDLAPSSRPDPSGLGHFKTHGHVFMANLAWRVRW